MEIKVIQRHFGAISTSIDDGSRLPIGSKIAAISSWKSSAQKIRVFGTAIPVSNGITVVKSLTQRPTLKAILEDYHLTIRGKAPLVFAPPIVSIKQVCQQLTEYAAAKNMGISWAFYAFAEPGQEIPSVIGMTPPVVKILLEEIPYDIYFEEGKWQDWMFKWIRRYMQAHRYFDATRFLLTNNWPSGVIADPEYLSDGPINVYEKMGELVQEPDEPAISLVNPIKRKRGRPAKS